MTSDRVPLPTVTIYLQLSYHNYMYVQLSTDTTIPASIEQY